MLKKGLRGDFRRDAKFSERKKIVMRHDATANRVVSSARVSMDCVTIFRAFFIWT